MSKLRVHELAKELNKSSKDIIYALKGHGIDVESHMSTVSTENAERIKRFYTQQAVVRQEGKSRPAGGQNQGNRPQGQNRQNRPGQDNRQQGQRRPYQGQGQDGQNRNNQNRQGQDSRPDNRQQGQRRPYQGQGQDGQNRNNQSRPYNNQNRDGQYNRDGQNRDGQNRPYNNQNRDGQSRPYNNQNRPYNNQNNNQNRPYNNQNRDNQNRPGQDGRPDNRQQGQRRPYQGQGQGQGQDGQNRGGQNRPYNNNNQNRGGYNNQNRQDGGGYNNQNRGGQGGGGNRRPGDNRGGQGGNRDGKFNLDSAISKEVVATKDGSRDNRRNFKDGNKDKDKNQRGKNDTRRPQGRGMQLAKKPLKPPTPRPKPVVEKVTNIVLPETVTLKELGDKMKISGAEIVKKLFLAGKMVSLNTEITYEEAEEIAMEYEVLCEHEVVVDVIEELLKEDDEDEKDMVTRPPVVCVMGHVDHGKTSILDAIRKTRVTTGEAGGITQHIGAYTVDVNGQSITFLDTPGHEAFTSMRLRGAQSTDIAILVVAADDGVMPQTIEAINHAKAAEIEIIVAINKIDKPSANIDRVKQELTEYELVAEDWGGQTIMVPVSAHTGEGLNDLLDMILLAAEVRELKANPNRNARGLIIEAELNKQRGPVATVLVQKGTLHVGDTLAAGPVHGKVRAMTDDKGRRVKVAGPSTPVEILGLNEAPQAGDIFIATDTDREARSIAETFISESRQKMLADTKSRLSLDGLFDQIQAGQIKELNIIVKADVQGSVEAVKQSLVKLTNEEVAVKVIHGAVGAINESDVILASASNAIIIGFNVRPDNTAKSIADQEKVDLRLYKVIYNAIEDVEAAMKGMLDPTFEEKVIGHAEVRQTYKVSGIGTIIGGYVLDGKFVRNCKARLLRDNVVIHDGELASLKRFKDDVKEVNTGYECGMSFEKFNDIKEGDVVEGYVMEEIPR